MGCLSLSVTPVPTHDVRIVADSNYSCALDANALNATVAIGKDTMGDVPVIVFQKVGGAGITAALVCRTSLAAYELLYVTDGVLMVTDGYLKVIRDGIERL